MLQVNPYNLLETCRRNVAYAQMIEALKGEQMVQFAKIYMELLSSGLDLTVENKVEMLGLAMEDQLKFFTVYRLFNLMGQKN